MKKKSSGGRRPNPQIKGKRRGGTGIVSTELEILLSRRKVTIRGKTDGDCRRKFS